MENNALIDALPLWGLFIAILGVVLISVECGYRLGKFRLSRREQEKEAPVGTMVGATLGLLAFILAFTFGLASSRVDNRRQLLLDEANALGTTYLRAGMLPEWGEEVRRLLRDYKGHRLDAVRSGDVTEGIRGRKTFNSRCGRKPRPSHRKTSIRLWLVCSRSGAAAVIATKLLLPWRWRLFWLSFLPTFRLPLSLAVIG